MQQYSTPCVLLNLPIGTIIIGYEKQLISTLFKTIAIVFSLIVFVQGLVPAQE